MLSSSKITVRAINSNMYTRGHTWLCFFLAVGFASASYDGEMGDNAGVSNRWDNKEMDTLEGEVVR